MTYEPFNQQRQLRWYDLIAKVGILVKTGRISGGLPFHCIADKMQLTFGEISDYYTNEKAIPDIFWQRFKTVFFPDASYISKKELSIGGSETAPGFILPLK